MDWSALKIESLALAALLLVPIIWWISRIIPPKPKTLSLPSAYFLLGLESGKNSANDAPIWLKILRMFALSALIIGIANPMIILEKVQNNEATNRIIILIEDSYTAANNYENTRSAIKSAFENLRITNNGQTQFHIIPISIGILEKDITIGALDINEAENLALNIQPKPFFFNHKNAATSIEKLNQKAKIYYFADGLIHENTELLLKELSANAIDEVQLYVPPLIEASALKSVVQKSNTIEFEYVAASKSSNVFVDFYSSNNIVLASVKGENGFGRLFLESINQTIARKIAYARIRGTQSASAVFLLDSFDRRALVGIEKPTEAEQPLLSDTNYIAAASKQFADVYQAEIKDLAQSDANAIIIGDRAGFSKQEADALKKFIDKGGLLVRYIGPQAISVPNDELVTAPFAPEPRNIKDALNIEPISISPFSANSPFFGIEPPKGAVPTNIAKLMDSEDSVNIWARLSDGTPFISARKFGKGEIIAIHTSAAPYWSDIAYSGLQPALLKRIISRANSPILPSNIRQSDLPMSAVKLIDGFGNLQSPPKPNPPIDMAKSKSPIWPGIYENIEARTIRQAYEQGTSFKAISEFPSNFETLKDNQTGAIKLQPLLLLMALLGLLFDWLYSIGLFAKLITKFEVYLRKLANFRLRFQAHKLVIFALFMFLIGADFSYAEPNNQNNLKPNPNGVKLAYLKTNDAANNAIMMRGLENLQIALNARTSVQAGPIIGLDASNDELALYPIIYWRLGNNPMPQSPIAQQRLNQFMRNGGLLFIDTRGAGLNQNLARQNVQIALSGLVVPPLEQVTQDHVLAKSFYLLYGFPGNFQNAKLWAQSRASLSASANDGVSPIVIGDGDYALAWGTLGHQNRNSALNVGINIYLYALTGQYKADQVHVPAILERQKARPK